MDGRFIAYYRVSTEHQGANGNGMAAQRKAVDYLNGGNWKLVGEFIEVEKLVIAKLNRLSRNVHFISGMMERKVDFVACDMPSATPFMLHVYAAVAEEERRMIAKRTKDDLAAAKARRVVLGDAELAKANYDAVVERAEALRPVFAELAGMSTRAAAAELDKRGIATLSGAKWSAMAVLRVREQLAA
jgi:DNA invertase Pin-like site-specific DNA recombinase